MKIALFVIAAIAVILLGDLALHLVEGSIRLIAGSVIPLAVGVAGGAGYTRAHNRKAISSYKQKQEIGV